MALKSFVTTDHNRDGTYTTVGDPETGEIFADFFGPEAPINAFLFIQARKTYGKLKDYHAQVESVINLDEWEGE